MWRGERRVGGEPHEQDGDARARTGVGGQATADRARSVFRGGETGSMSHMLEAPSGSNCLSSSTKTRLSSESGISTFQVKLMSWSKRKRGIVQRISM